MLLKRISFTVTLMVLLAAAPFTTADLFDTIADTVCGTIVSGLRTGKCVDEFRNNYKEFKDQDEIPQYVVCCGASIMKACLEDEVVKQCGEGAKGVSSKLAEVVFQTVNDVSGRQLECDWNNWYFDRMSPVCWPIWAQAVGGIVILALLLGSCCSCICCCRSKRRGGRTYNPVTKARA